MSIVVPNQAHHHPRRVLAAAVLTMLGLGSLYAWSIFLEPLQDALGAARASVSLVFALATISFAASMLAAPALYRRLAAPAVAAAACLLAALGLGVGAFSQSLIGVQLGYGVLFGVANGIGYGMALQIANEALPARRGLATGTVVAAYAAGAVMFTPLLRAGVEGLGVWPTLAGMAVLMAMAGAVVGGLLWPVRSILHGVAAHRADGDAGPVKYDRLFWLLWAGFLLGASAGLMALGHAAGLVAAYGGPEPAIAAGTALIATTNGAGRLTSGWLSDHLPLKAILTVAAAIGALALAALAAWPGPVMVFLCLALVGLSYGLLAAGFAAAAVHIYGTARVSLVFGRLFTAWGLAGLSAPVIAGAIFDATGTYRLAALFAAACAAGSLVCSLGLPNDRASRA